MNIITGNNDMKYGLLFPFLRFEHRDKILNKYTLLGNLYHMYAFLGHLLETKFHLV